MALPNSNISISMVRNELGESSNDLSVLCKSDKINQYSKYKPVRYNYPTHFTEYWYQGTAGNCGLVIPVWERGVKKEWSYLPPRGGADEPYRLSDFAGYDHNATSLKVKQLPDVITQLPVVIEFDTITQGSLSLLDFAANRFFGIELDAHNDNGSYVRKVKSVDGLSIDISDQIYNGGSYTLRVFATNIDRDWNGSLPPGFNDERYALPALGGASMLEHSFTVDLAPTTPLIAGVCEHFAITQPFWNTDWLSPTSGGIVTAHGDIAMWLRLQSTDGTVNVQSTDFSFSVFPTYGGDSYIADSLTMTDSRGNHINDVDVPESGVVVWLYAPNVLNRYKNKIMGEFDIALVDPVINIKAKYQGMTVGEVTRTFRYV